MQSTIEQRACELADYILENRTTIRAAAAKFGVSKSTAHKDLTERLPSCRPALYSEVRKLLDLNKAERHIRGGLATRQKYRARGADGCARAGQDGETGEKGKGRA